MGLATDLLVKDRDKKFWINVLMDMILIIILVLLALYASVEYRNGWNDCKKQACEICFTNLKAYSALLVG
jgi:hypothetical protein